jgi:hypothetical protein
MHRRGTAPRDAVVRQKRTSRPRRHDQLIDEITTKSTHQSSKGSEMALSDQLSRLAARAKEFEDRASAANTKTKADLEQDVNKARESAQSQADALRKSAADSKGRISSWWDSVERSWNEHLSAVRKNVQDKKAEHDLKSAQRKADQADDDASFAIDYAYAAIEEAEYAVLDARLAHMEADDLTEAGASS